MKHFFGLVSPFFPYVEQVPGAWHISNAVFYPKKHTVQSYRSQQRAKKKRKK
jgi:hypothetical protein